MVVLDLLRLFVGVAILAFASYTDWLWRRAPNVLWTVLAGVGVVLLAVEAWLDPAPWPAKWPYLLPLAVVLLLVSSSGWGDALAAGLAVAGVAGAALVSRAAPDALTAQWSMLALAVALAGFVYAAWWFGLIAGGADAKALLALCVLMPFPVSLGDALPLWRSPVPGAFTVLADSLVLFLLIPVSLLVWNLARGHVRFPHMVLGVKREARSVRRGHAWPMEVVDAEGKRRTRLFASRMSDSEIDETFERVQALGAERVWVTPKIPFMIPMLAGLLAAFTLGDMLFVVLSGATGSGSGP